jgi:hypothetical protein
MNSHPTVYALVVAGLRLTAVFLILVPIYKWATSFFGMPAAMVWAYFGLLLRSEVIPVVAALVLWFSSRPIANLVLRGLDNA